MGMTKPTPLGARRGFFAPLPSSEMNWKLRVALFSKQVFEFRKPFNPSKITAVENPDEVAYTKCRLRADILTTNPEIALYIEINICFKQYEMYFPPVCAKYTSSNF